MWSESGYCGSDRGRQRRLWAKTGHRYTRIIRGQVLSEHVHAAVVAVETVASHHADSHFLPGDRFRTYRACRL
jgi:hypothetical protein